MREEGGPRQGTDESKREDGDDVLEKDGPLHVVSRGEDDGGKDEDEERFRVEQHKSVELVDCAQTLHSNTNEDTQQNGHTALMDDGEVGLTNGIRRQKGHHQHHRHEQQRQVLPENAVLE